MGPDPLLLAPNSWSLAGLGTRPPGSMLTPWSYVNSRLGRRWGISKLLHRNPRTSAMQGPHLTESRLEGGTGLWDRQPWGQTLGSKRSWIFFIERVTSAHEATISLTTVVRLYVGAPELTHNCTFVPSDQCRPPTTTPWQTTFYSLCKDYVYNENKSSHSEFSLRITWVSEGESSDETLNPKKKTKTKSKFVPISRYFYSPQKDRKREERRIKVRCQFRSKRLRSQHSKALVKCQPNAGGT